MPYARHKVCQLLTTYGHVMMLLQREGSLRKFEIAQRIGITEEHTNRMLRELRGEGLVTYERYNNSVWWRLSAEDDLPQRFTDDRQLSSGILA